MRLPVSLLVVTAFLVGCSTDEDPVITQTISISSTPTSAAVRLNGNAVGRTPTTISVESNSDYQLEVGKGGFSPSITELKPSLKTDSKGNMYYGFPEKISVTLDRLPGSDEVAVPENDEKQFRQLARKAVATVDQKVAEPGSPESLKNSVSDIKDDIAEAKQKLAARDAATATKVEGLKKSLAEAKGADGQKVDEQRIATIEAQIAAQEKAAEADRQATANLLKALSLRNEELIRLNSNSIAIAKEEATKEIEAQKAQAAKEAEEKVKADAAKQLAEAQKSAEEQKAVAAKEAEERTKAQLAKQLADAQKTAEQEKELAKAEADKQLASVQRVVEEQKAVAAKADEQRATAEQQRIAAEQQRAAAELEAKKRAYAEFNSRYALLESRRRNKLITEDEFKEQLTALRKELTK
jgi:hypothetical protein